MDFDVMWVVVAAGLVIWLLVMLVKAWSVRKVEEEGEQSPNPYHAVAIRVRGKGCDAARAHAGKRFLSTEAPRLPFAECTASTCSCQYIHFDDRRHYERRGPYPLRMYAGGERRYAIGRRLADRLEPIPGR